MKQPAERFAFWMNAVDDELLEEALRPATGKTARPLRFLRYAAAAVLAVAVGVTALVNLSPTVAAALESIPALGDLIRLVDYRTYTYRDREGNALVLPQPQAEGSAPGVDELNRSIEEETAQLRARFDAALDAAGYGRAAQETTYEIVRNDDALFTLRFVTTLNLGGSGEFSRYITLDRGAGEVLALADLFRPGADYITPISENLIGQMTKRRDAGEGDYFVPGGIWSDEECFTAIDPEQNFYLDEQNRLVIVFDEYQVSPGSGGMPEFTVPTEVLGGILADGSPLN